MKIEAILQPEKVISEGNNTDIAKSTRRSSVALRIREKKKKKKPRINSPGLGLGVTAARTGRHKSFVLDFTECTKYVLCTRIMRSFRINNANNDSCGGDVVITRGDPFPGPTATDRHFRRGGEVPIGVHLHDDIIIIIIITVAAIIFAALGDVYTI